MNWRAAAVLFCLAPLLCACATGVKGSPRRISYEAGLQPGTAEFSSCWRNVARAQGTLPYDDPQALEIYGAILQGMAAGADSTDSTVLGSTSEPKSGSRPSPIIGRQYFVTRTGPDLYDLAGGPLVATRFCYVMASTTPAMIVGDKILFVPFNQSCDIANIHSR